MTRIKNDTYTYKDLIDDLVKGLLKIPAFQRDFVWDLERTLKLVDSIARHYPIGSFLLWESIEPFRYVREIGSLRFADPPEGRAVQYVLDGQQRITSLFAATQGATIRNKSYEVFCNLDATDSDEAIFVLQQADPLRDIPLSKLLGDSQHLVYDTLTQPRKARFNTLRERFLEYTFPYTRVRDADLDTVCTIFERVNTSGVALSIFDLVVARTWSEKFDLRSEFHDLIEDLRPVGFEGIDPAVVIQAASAMLKHSVRRKDVLSIGREEMADHWPEICDGVKRAVDFLRTTIRLKAWRLLPYQQSLIPIAYCYWRLGGKAVDSRLGAALASMFWHVSLSGRYASSTETLVTEDLASVDSWVDGAFYRLDYFARVDTGEIARTYFSIGNAYCKAVLAFLGSLGPKSFKDNGDVILDNSYLVQANSRHYHHFFPRDFLKKAGATADSNSVANITLIPAELNLRVGAKSPATYLEPFIKDNPHLRESLASHLIFDLDEFGVLSGEYERFIEKRSEAISSRMRSHLEGLDPGWVNRGS